MILLVELALWALFTVAYLYATDDKAQSARIARREERAAQRRWIAEYDAYFDSKYGRPN